MSHAEKIKDLKFLTTQEFDEKLEQSLDEFLKSVPFLVRIFRKLTSIYFTNVETDQELVYEIDYKLSRYENIHRIDLLFYQNEWYPQLLENYLKERPLSIDERQALVDSGKVSFEEAYSTKGVLEPHTRVWRIQQLTLRKNRFVLISDSEMIELYVRPEYRVSAFLSDCRKNLIPLNERWRFLTGPMLKSLKRRNLNPLRDARWKELPQDVQ